MDKRVKDYVEAYAKQRGITPKEALEHEMVKGFIEYTKERENDNDGDKMDKT